MEQVERTGEGSDDAAASMIQRFWDSAMALGPLDDETDTQSQIRFPCTSSSKLSESSDPRFHLSVYTCFISFSILFWPNQRGVEVPDDV